MRINSLLFTYDVCNNYAGSIEIKKVEICSLRILCGGGQKKKRYSYPIKSDDWIKPTNID